MHTSFTLVNLRGWKTGTNKMVVSMAPMAIPTAYNQYMPPFVYASAGKPNMRIDEKKEAVKETDTGMKLRLRSPVRYFDVVFCPPPAKAW